VGQGNVLEFIEPGEQHAGSSRHHLPLFAGTKDSVGNELGFLVGSIPCVFDQGRRLKPSTLMRTVAKYNASQEHRGVMSLWLMSAEITKKTTTSEGAIIL